MTTRQHVTRLGAPAGSGAAQSALVPVLADYLADLSHHTAGRLGDVAGVAVTFGVDGDPWTIGASSELAREVDLIQYEVGTGPCLTALREGIGMYVPDLGADGRWGSYGPRAAARGAASCVSLPVTVRDRVHGVFKVYDGEVDGLSKEQRDIAAAVAVEIAGGIGLAVHLSEHAQLLDDRRAAMDGRRAIDLAIGVLMERSGVDPDEAFGQLRTVSQTRNVKLKDAAREVLQTIPAVTADDFPAHFKPRGEAPD